MSEVRRKRIDKIKKRKEKKKRTIGFGNLYPFDLAIIILVISFILFLLLCSEDNRSRGLSIATLGLVMPIMIILVVVWILEFFIPIDYTILSQKINSHRLLEVLILYYIYSVTIFYYSGAKSGEACKKSNQVEFVIKTADGSTYNDSTYCYIDYINDKVFLMNKKNSHNIILNNENITYTDIHCIGDERKSLITIFFDSIRDRYHAH